MKVFAILTVAVATALMLLTIPSAATPRARIQPFGPTVGHAQFLVNPLHVSERAHPVNYNGSAPDAKTIGIEYAEKYLLHGSEYRIQSSYTSPHNSVTHLYLRQLVDGLEVLNGDININVDVDGIRDDPVSDPVIGSSDSISPQNALLSFAQYLNIEILHPENMTLISTPSLDPSQPDHSLTNCPLASDGNVPFGIAYLQTDDGSSLEPVYDFKIDMKGMDNWFHAQIHAESGKVLRVLDWVSDAVYNVYPVGTNDPSDGDRQLVVNPEDIATASPQGWVRAPTQGNNSGYVSSGNNVMRMYIWDLTSVARDGDLDNGIIIHEYAHGISNRLTGGPANVGCLPWGEAGGMGEGWGDFFATMLRQRPEHNYDSVFKMGDYVNDGAGIRRFPYSTSMTINTETYQSLDGSAYWGVHAKGAVWANILYEVYRNLETVLPFSSEWQVDDKT
ncbi:Fungalysin/Thermolysin Extracellular metalloproteinase 5, partial [Lunasporangiospora selenospora]